MSSNYLSNELQRENSSWLEKIDKKFTKKNWKKNAISFKIWEAAAWKTVLPTSLDSYAKRSFCSFNNRNKTWMRKCLGKPSRANWIWTELTVQCKYIQGWWQLAVRERSPCFFPAHRCLSAFCLPLLFFFLSKMSLWHITPSYLIRANKSLRTRTEELHFSCYCSEFTWDTLQLLPSLVCVSVCSAATFCNFTHVAQHFLT